MCNTTHLRSSFPSHAALILYCGTYCLQGGCNGGDSVSDTRKHCVTAETGKERRTALRVTAAASLLHNVWVQGSPDTCMCHVTAFGRGGGAKAQGQHGSGTERKGFH
jgi:hypothetical protein